MKDTVSNVAPKARHEKLVVREMGEEVVLYDRTSQKALCLNPTAAFVWQHCDGQTTIEELAVLLQAKLGTPVSEQLVWYTLGQLADGHLLEEELSKPEKTMNRRQVLQMLGAAGTAAVAVPTIASILAPSVYAAVSAGVTYVGAGQACAAADNGSQVKCCAPPLVCCTKGNQIIPCGDVSALDPPRCVNPPSSGAGCDYNNI